MAAILRLYSRLTRRGITLLVVAVAAYVVVEVASYVQTYPDQASRQRLAEFGDQPAVRMLQGIPHAVDTVGGFVVWDGGWFLQAVVGVWAILVTTRLLRAEEDSGRAELVGAGRASSIQVMTAGMVVVAVGCVLAGVATFASIVVSSEDVLGAALFAAGIAGFGLVMCMAAAVASQLVSVRRRAAGAAAGFLGIAFVLRMIANSGDEQSWVGWISAFGWMDRLRPFGDNNAAVVLVYGLVASALCGLALALRRRRDLGAAIVSRDREQRSRTLLLQSPIRFGWRLTWGALTAWVVGVGVYSFFIGSLIKSMGEVLVDDPTYESYLDLLGLTAADVYLGMVAAMAVVIALVVSLYLAWRIGAVRNEEDSERVDQLLTRPLTRGRWLGGHLVLAVASVLLLMFVNAGSTWVGARLTDAPVSFVDLVAASANLLPVILLFGSLAVAMFGLAPRLTIAVPVAAAAVAYVVSFVGPALDLPGWVTGFSPFYHVALVPVADYATMQGLVMLGLSIVVAGIGWVAFQRRDLVGA